MFSNKKNILKSFNVVLYIETHHEKCLYNNIKLIPEHIESSHTLGEIIMFLSMHFLLKKNNNYYHTSSGTDKKSTDDNFKAI